MYLDKDCSRKKDIGKDGKPYSSMWMFEYDIFIFSWVVVARKKSIMWVIDSAQNKLVYTYFMPVW